MKLERLCIVAAQRLSSAAASAPQESESKANDLAREAVGWNDLFGGMSSASCIHIPQVYHAQGSIFAVPDAQ
jgi:hypothetical protein